VREHERSGAVAWRWLAVVLFAVGVIAVALDVFGIR